VDNIVGKPVGGARKAGMGAAAITLPQNESAVSSAESRAYLCMT
jgi:hypothetical protein